MTDQVRVDKQQVYDLLDGIRAALPGAVQRAQPPAPVASGPPSRPPRAIFDDSPEKLLATLDALDDFVENAKRVPLSDDRRINPQRFYELIERARAGVPEAIKAAKWVFAEYREAWAAAEADGPSEPGMADGDLNLNLDLGIDEPSA